MKATYFVVAFFMTCAMLYAQSSAKQFQFIASDKLGYTYAIYHRGIHKLDSVSTTVLRVYEDFDNGTITSADVTNPLKILVFYSDLQRVVILDRNLTFISRYDLLSLGYTNITAVASSADGRFWLYDAADFKLKKVDENGLLIRESQPLQMLTDETVLAQFLMEQNGSVYLTDSNRGIFEFDLFASYKRMTPLHGISRFEPVNGQFVFTRNSQLVQYNPLLLQEKVLFTSSHAPVQQILIHGRYAVELRDGQVLMTKLQ